MNRPNSTDRMLILQYLERDLSMLPVLVERYHKEFCQKAYWVIKDKEAAKDIAQDSWITIIQKLDTLKDLDRFQGWAMRIVYTKAIDAIKLRNKENKIVDDIPITEQEDQTSITEQRRPAAMLKAIQQLPKAKQDIIRLFYTEEYSIKEISEFLNIPIGTVKSRLFKARAQLKSIK